MDFDNDNAYFAPLQRIKLTCEYELCRSDNKTAIQTGSNSANAKHKHLKSLH